LISILFAELRRCLSLIDPGTCLCDGRPALFPMFGQDAFGEFGSLAARHELCREGFDLGGQAVDLPCDGFVVEFDQHVAGLHGPPQLEVCLCDLTCGGCLEGASQLAHFDAGGGGDFEERQASREKPYAPGEEQERQEADDGMIDSRALPIGSDGAHGPLEVDLHFLSGLRS